MRSSVAAAVALCTGLALHGCDSPAPAPTPTPAPVPEPEVTIVVEDNSQQVIDANAMPTKVPGPSFSVYRSANGPVWLPSSARWVFSDTPSTFMWSWDPTSNAETTDFFRHPTGQVIGSALMGDNNLLMCEESGRRVSNMDLTTNTVDDFVTMADGENLIAPTDIIVSKTGQIYVTDAQPNTNDTRGHVIRVDPSNGNAATVQSAVTLLETSGIALNVAEDAVYVVDSDNAHNFVCQYDINATTQDISGSCSLFATSVGVAGIKVDSLDNVWVTSDSGVTVYGADQTKLVTINVAGGVSNLAFGGADGTTVMLTAYGNVYTLPTKVKAQNNVRAVGVMI